MNQFQALVGVVRVILERGDPIGYVFFALVVCLLVLGGVALWGNPDHAVGDFTIAQGVMTIALFLTVGLILLTLVRVFRR